MGTQMVTDLTKGNITKSIIQFTIPLILGNLFQLTYNAVDSIIVGRFAGKDALAAVGTADPVMNLLILGITGLCIGASVLMSNFFGAGQIGRLRREVGTTLVLGSCLAAVVLIFGLIFSNRILILMKVPEEILNQAVKYLRIIFIGMPFTCFYNIFAAALRSVGDSKTPIRFLMISSVINGCLDVLLVAVFKIGVAGAGIATVIAEGISAILCLVYIYKKVPLLHLTAADFVPDVELVKNTVSYGGVTALQQCSQPIGKLLIQGVINTLGVSTIAAFNAVGKIEDFALVPGRSISNAMMTFTAQNMGAQKKDRVKQGFKSGIMLELCYGVIIFAVLIFLAYPMLMLFGGDADMIDEGLKYFAVIAAFYWMPALTNGLQGFFRGMGNMSITLCGTLTQVSFRVIFTFVFVPYVGIKGVAIACIMGWIAMLALEIPYQRWLTHKKLVSNNKE